MNRSLPIAFFAVLLAASAASAERAPEDKEKATHVLTGKVAKVFTRRDGRLTEYVVQMIVSEVHKGEGVKEGDAFYAYVFMKSPPLFGFVAEPRGHSAVPKEGQTIKAWIQDRAGRHEGNYKDWFETVAEKDAQEKK